jgi:uncharacterized protein (TIGR02594 family)
MKKIVIILTFFLTACGSTDFVPTYKRGYDHPQYQFVKTANAFYGWNEEDNRSGIKQLTGVDPVYIEWCAAFVNAVLKQNNTLGSESVSEYPLTARSFMFWGERVLEPKIGDVVVFPRGNKGWQGHVGFYIETRTIKDIDYYVILGGNQEDAVTYDLYPAYKALSIRRGFPTQPDHE